MGDFNLHIRYKLKHREPSLTFELIWSYFTILYALQGPPVSKRNTFSFRPWTLISYSQFLSCLGGSFRSNPFGVVSERFAYSAPSVELYQCSRSLGPYRRQLHTYNLTFTDYAGVPWGSVNAVKGSMTRKLQESPTKSRGQACHWHGRCSWGR